jgi:hypothetical protein
MASTSVPNRRGGPHGLAKEKPQKPGDLASPAVRLVAGRATQAVVVNVVRRPRLVAAVRAGILVLRSAAIIGCVRPGPATESALRSANQAEHTPALNARGNRWNHLCQHLPRSSCQSWLPDAPWLTVAGVEHWRQLLASSRQRRGRRSRDHRRGGRRARHRRHSQRDRHPSPRPRSTRAWRGLARQPPARLPTTDRPRAGARPTTR